MAEAVINQPSKEEQELKQMRDALPEAGPLAPESASESLPEKTPEPETPEPIVSEQKPVDAPVEKPLSDRANVRYQELAHARKAAEDKAAQLEAERNNLLQVLATKQEIEEIPSEITPEQYQADVAKKAQQVVKLTLSQEREVQRRQEAQKHFLEDYRQVRSNPLFDEESPEYDSELDQMVGDYYEIMLQKDPSTRLTDIVDKFVKQREKGQESARKERINKVAKQASQQALAPTAGQSETTSLLDEIKRATTEEELEAVKAKLPQTY